MKNLYWHCANCGSHKPFEPTRDAVGYKIGDIDQCTDCYSPSYLVTIKEAAAIEQAWAIGVKVDINRIIEATKEAK